MESQTANLFPPNTSWQADLVVSIWFLDQEEFWLACKSPGTPFITDLEPAVWIVKHGHVLSGDLVVLGTALDVEIMNRPSELGHELTDRLVGHRDAVPLEKLLGRQGRPEIRIMGGDQSDDSPPEALWEPSPAGSATLARHQAISAILANGSAKSLDLADTKTENARSLEQRQPAFQNSRDDLESIQFRMAHGYCPSGHVGELPMPGKATFIR
jgi:hypothetical protein